MSILEFYLKLHNAKGISFVQQHGSTHQIDREDVLGAAVLAAKKHPLGHAVFLASNGDESYIRQLIEWARSILPELAEEIVMVALERPLPGHISNLVMQSPRYIRERRRAGKLMVEAKQLERQHHPEAATEKRAQADWIRNAAFERVQHDIMATGRCPLCSGTGLLARKQEQCSLCHGSGKTIPTLDGISRKYPGQYQMFRHVVEVLQGEMGEWIHQLNNKL